MISMNEKQIIHMTSRWEILDQAPPEISWPTSLLEVVILAHCLSQTPYPTDRSFVIRNINGDYGIVRRATSSISVALFQPVGVNTGMGYISLCILAFAEDGSVASIAAQWSDSVSSAQSFLG